MVATARYCSREDLQLGNVPIPDTADRYIREAAEEIDSVIGFRYVTPVMFPSETALNRPARLLLKKICAFLATGRLLLAVDAPNEDDQLHTFGRYMVDEAMMALTAIRDGTVTLPGVDPVNPDVPVVTGPQIAQLDDASAVEAFGSVFGNPASQVITTNRYPLYGSPYTY